MSNIKELIASGEFDKKQDDNREYIQEVKSTSIPERREAIRSTVTLVIVWAFVAFLALLFVLSVCIHCGVSINQDILTYVFNMGQTFLMPVLMLCLGFYFGSERE